MSAASPSDGIALAVIGGTGLYKLSALDHVETLEGDTVYGNPSGPVRVGQIAGHRVAFLARHGEDHSIPPHRVNYRANLRRLLDLGAKRVLAINTVGGITERYSPRTLACPDQIIDYTWGRVSSLWDEPGGAPLHVDFSDPYSADLRRAVLAASAQSGVAVIAGGCYGATQGPRLESRAEIARLRRDGCDLVGMTGMPEAGLARELGLGYACLALSANWAAGCGDDAEITLAEVLANVAAASAVLPDLLAALLTVPMIETGRG